MRAARSLDAERRDLAENWGECRSFQRDRILL